MKKFNKILSLLLAALMMLGSMVSVMTVMISAEETTNTDTDTETETKTELDIEGYISKVYVTPEDKLATMKLKLTKGNFELYVDELSGEVATKNVETGDILFSNPYDVASSVGSDKTKYELLSQIIVKYTDKSNGSPKEFCSYEMAALRDQIVVKNIKSGIRVEYTIGKDQSRSLVPRLISKDRFENYLLPIMKENMGDSEEGRFMYEKFEAYYLEKNLDKLTSEKMKKDLEKAWPITKKMPVYIFSPDATEVQINLMEEYIKTYVPDYTYEDLDYDHNLTEYESEDENPPVFKLALEYTLGDDGISVRLPANGIRFNESLYQLEYISVLPYMGAGNYHYDGYNFYPDGSGTLFSYNDLRDKKENIVRGSVYGTDFAYHEINGTYQKTISYPVFGVVEDTVYHTYVTTNDDGDETTKTINGHLVDIVKDGTGKAPLDLTAIITNTAATENVYVKSRGYMAIIEEGDALASIISYHAGSLSNYDTMKMEFNPRPKDSYVLSDSISVGTNDSWTVTSDRKYVGSYRIKYVMLTDVNEDTPDGYYDASWFGMAVAYRDYLTQSGILTKLTEKDLEEDIPLYIETFGTIETLEKIMSMPVYVMTPLTSFENIKTMYMDLSGQNKKETDIELNDGETIAEQDPVTNIIFKLTGYANGGMFYTVPYRFNIEKAVGNESGFQELLNYAAEENKKEGTNLKIFPDFDYEYIIEQDTFDGVWLTKHVVRTIDDRYASRREYSATLQATISWYELAISPAYFQRFVEKSTGEYLEFDNVTGISVSTLGNALNSDFDEDEPYNREDSKSFTINTFSYLDERFNEIMTDKANAYTWKYVDHILNATLDSSRFDSASFAVPFLGVVLHGSIRFAGEPLNMEGDLKYAMLKAIENGASPYFILSYQNTQKLKEFNYFSEYYSVRYDIWKDDMIEVYNTLNDVLCDVQDKYITDHEFLSGLRVPDSDELEADIREELENLANSELNAVEIAKKEQLLAVSNARATLRDLNTLTQSYKASALDTYYQAKSAYDTAIERLSALEEASFKVTEYKALGYDQYADSEDETEQALYKEYLDAEAQVKRQRSRSITACVSVGGTYLSSLKKQFNEVVTGLEKGQDALELLKTVEGINPLFIQLAQEQLDNSKSVCYVTEFKIIEIDEETLGKMKITFTYNENTVVGYNEDGDKIFYDVDRNTNEKIYYSSPNENPDAEKTYYSFQKSLKDCYEGAQGLFDYVIEYAESLGIKEKEITDKIKKTNVVIGEEEETVVEEHNKYETDNIVAITYGNADGSAYKVVLLNYNYYVVTVEYNGISYTIPAYEFVTVNVSGRGGN